MEFVRRPSLRKCALVGLAAGFACTLTLAAPPRPGATADTRDPFAHRAAARTLTEESADVRDGQPPPVGPPVTCQPGQTLEGEPVCADGYIDDFNGGCNSAPPVFSPIVCGEEYCGEAGVFNGGNTRDTDWYRVVLNADTEVTWEVVAEFPVLFGVVQNFGQDDCVGVVSFVVSGQANPNQIGSVTTCLPAGTWYLFVAPDAFNGVPCGSLYNARLDCAPCVVPVGACCLPDGSCQEVAQGICTGLGGAYEGDGVLCADVMCQVICGPGAGACLANNGTPGCDDGACCALICALDPFCCDVQWDQICADAAANFCDIVVPERAHPGWNYADNAITLTMNEPTYWSALTGQPKGVVPFGVLDPPGVGGPGRPAMDGTTDRVLRGYVVAWAVDSQGRQIRWNHLKGEGTIVNYGRNYAWEYNAYTYAVNQSAAAHGALVGTAGTLKMDGVEYAANFDELILNFQASDSTAWSTGPGVTPPHTILSNTDLTLHPMGADLQQTNGGPITTKASILIWNENETKFSGTHRCISCWDETLLSLYAAPPNSFTRMFLQTDHGKARIDGLAAPVQCDILDDPSTPEDESVTSIDAPLLGVHARLLAFDGNFVVVGVGSFAAAGGNLFGLGEDATATILYDITGQPGEATGPDDDARYMLGTRTLRGFEVTDAADVAGAAADGPPSLARVSATDKGSLVVFPKVELRWDQNGNFIQDTFLSLTNDFPADVRVQLYFINGDPPLEAVGP